jgi:hypothetical protein
MNTLRIGLASLVVLSTACGGNSGGDSQNFVSTYCTEVAKCCGQAGLPSDGKLANGGACTSSSVCQSDYCSNNACQGSSNVAMSFLCGT